MSWLFGSPKPASPASSFGVVTDSKFKAAVKIDEFSKQLNTTSSKLKNEVNKYKQIAALNKKLTESYVTNYTTMIDISKLLKDYAEIFDKLSVILQKYENIEISPIDMDHLKQITKEKLDQITGEFNKQSKTIGSLYTKYGMGDELRKISAVEPLAREVGMMTNAVLPTFAKPSSGGKRKYKKKK
jgi:hypothetical protein